MPSTTIQKDIEGPAQIETLVRAFYTKVYQDEVLRPVFTEVAKVDLEKHLPIMNRFWNKILFGTEGYDGNPFRPHIPLHLKSPFGDCHFIRWLSLFQLTVDQNFSGPTAEKAKKSAAAISHSFQLRLNPNSLKPIKGNLI